jgi:hypothetical protein
MPRRSPNVEDRSIHRRRGSLGIWRKPCDNCDRSAVSRRPQSLAEVKVLRRGKCHWARERSADVRFSVAENRQIVSGQARSGRDRHPHSLVFVGYERATAFMRVSSDAENDGLARG